MHEWSAEVTVGEELARRLIGEQFPELDLRTIRLLGEGWDATVWLVDEEWVFRFPRRSVVIQGIENEVAVLPKLAPLLPLPIPVPTFVGRPSDDFAWPFYGAPFLPGRELADAALEDEAEVELARPLAEFLRTLHAVELDAELPVDPVGRADMAVRVPLMIERLEDLERLGLWQAPDTVRDLAGTAQRLGPPKLTTIVHGDLHPRHLLVGETGKPTAVIDWIDLCRSDRGVDLVLYWSAFPSKGRAEFLKTYGLVTEDQLLRGRVLAVFLCATLAIYGYHARMGSLERAALRGLARATA